MNVSDEDPRPPYVQVAEDVKHSIAAGDLRPGQRMPTGRALAQKYKVSPNTIQRSVERLKAERLLVAHSTRGLWVAAEREGGQEELGHSTEFVEVMRHLDGVDRTVHDLSERLARLEALVEGQASDPTSTQTPRGPAGRE